MSNADALGQQRKTGMAIKNEPDPLRKWRMVREYELKHGYTFTDLERRNLGLQTFGSARGYQRGGMIYANEGREIGGIEENVDSQKNRGYNGTARVSFAKPSGLGERADGSGSFRDKVRDSMDEGIPRYARLGGDFGKYTPIEHWQPAIQSKHGRDIMRPSYTPAFDRYRDTISPE